MSRDSIAQQFEKEHIYIVEIDVPRCVYTLGSSPCLSNATGDAKCYNTRTTCKDDSVDGVSGNGFAYNDQINFTGSVSITPDTGAIAGSGATFISDGFKVGQIITTSGFTNEGNNSQFEIAALTQTIITVKSNDGMVLEFLASGRSISGTNIYTYKFCSARSPHPAKMNNIPPCVSDVSIAPAKVDSAGGIGARSSASVSMDDFPSSDRNGIDPYLSDRTYNPLDIGLFFTRWRARNANYENYFSRILSGYIVNNTFTATNFEPRHYILASMTATGGKAGFTFKDPLHLISNKKALAPVPSKGILTSDLPAINTSFTIEPAGEGNASYPASGFIKIRKEVMSFTRTNDSFTVVRAQNNTIAEAHSSGDTVQLSLHYTGKSVDLVQADLMKTYSFMPAIYIPTGAWFAEVDTYLPSNPERLITDPTPVDKLIQQLCETWTHKFFWNDRARQIEMVAIKAPPVGGSNEINNDKNILELSVRDKPDMQLSTIFVLYGQFDPTKKIDETDNYQITAARINTDAIARYDSNNSKTIYAPWISENNGAAARRVATIYGRRFGIIPREISLALEDKDSALWIGDVIDVSHPDISDFNGNNLLTPFEITQAAEGDTYTYQALEYNYDEELAEDEALGIETIDYNINVNNINLLTDFTAVYGAPDASTVARFIIYSGVCIGSTNNATYSIQTGTWPVGARVIIQVNAGAVVAGKGGDGADVGGVPEAGGPALNLGADVEILNNGDFGGGGGGGHYDIDIFAMAAGGGGAGCLIGLAGSGSGVTGSEDPIFDEPAQDGSKTTGGSGAVVSYGGTEPAFSRGGNGGDLGQPGGNGSGGTGSAAGKAVNLNGFTVDLTGNALQGLVS